MSEPFLGEVKIVGFNFAPRGWATCDGQILPINQNQSLYSLLGTTYGGDGRTTFALPDLRGRTPLHFASGFTQGARSGEENHTLTTGETPSHTHALKGSSDAANSASPAGLAYARSAMPVYGAAANLTAMNAGVVANAGGGQAHNNMQPVLVVNFVIALQGLFPPRN